MNRRKINKLLIAAPLGMLLSKPAFGINRILNNKKKILLPIGDATEAMDTLYPFFRLQEEGYEVVVCGPEKRVYNMVIHEVPPNPDVPWDITKESPGYHIEAVLAFKDIDPSEYAGLFVSGGRAPEYLRYNQELLGITRHFFEENKPVAVVCHGVEIVAAAGVIEGRKMTTVAKCALDITQFGGEYIPKPLVSDGNMVSCRTWNDYGTQFMKIFIENLNAYNG